MEQVKIHLPRPMTFQSELSSEVYLKPSVKLLNYFEKVDSERDPLNLLKTKTAITPGVAMQAGRRIRDDMLDVVSPFIEKSSRYKLIRHETNIVTYC